MSIYPGYTLTATPASVAGAPTPARTWQWLSGGSTIAGAVASTYVIQDSDVGNQIMVQQTETNFLGSATAFSAATPAVVPFTPEFLFTAGESGYWLDPSDFSTMFQDSAGTTPVTATGQTCGLILDKRIGTRTQVFDDANVTFGGPAGYAGRVSPGVYEYARDAGGGGSAAFGGLVVGRTYLVSLQISAYAGAFPGITGISAQIRNASNVAVGTPLSAAGTLNLFYVADGTFFRVTSNFNGSGATISNVSILEVPGNHFLQATAGNRPIVQTDGTNRFLLFDGTDDGMQSAATINPGAVDKAQVFAGMRKLSDAAGGILVEASVNANLNAGSFFFSAPSTSTNPNYGFLLRGSAACSFVATTYAAPITNVLSCQYDIAQPDRTTEIVPRINGVTPTLAATGPSSVGTGNFLTYAHYIGRRAGSSAPSNVRLYQLITRYGANLTAGQITQTETFVNSKTGAY